MCDLFMTISNDVRLLFVTISNVVRLLFVTISSDVRLIFVTISNVRLLFWNYLIMCNASLSS